MSLKYRTRREACIAAVGIFFGLALGCVGTFYFIQYEPPIKLTTILPYDEATAVVDASPAVAIGSLSAAVAPQEEKPHAGTTTDENMVRLWSSNNLFDSTLRSCLSNECYNAPVTYKDGVKRDRIGFLAPDPQGMSSLLGLLNKASKKDLAKDFNVVLDTHVPPYGYGKNHGWTRIVRFVHRITPQAEALLRRAAAASPPASSASAASAGAGATAIIPSLYELQVRQLVRWHCRLSHVAAHTRMLTVYMDDLAVRAVPEIYQILSFIGFRGNRQDIVEAVEAMHAQVIQELGVGHLSPLGTSVQHEVNASLAEAGIKAITEEMGVTGGLQKWPCQTFNHLDGTNKKESVNLPLKAKTLAADCSGEYVVCSVPVDRRGG